MHRFGIHTYFPVHIREIVRSRWNWRTQQNERQTYTRERPVFPGYVFAMLDPGVWALIRERVAYRPKWLTCDGAPAPIPIQLIEDLRERELNGFVQLECASTEYKQGDELEVTDGVYRGWRGILSSDPDRRILTLHMITESYALEPTMIIRPVKVDREHLRRVN